MNLFKRLSICIVVILLATTYVSQAKYKSELRPFFSYLTDPRRWEIGGTYTTVNGTFNGVIPIYGYNNRYLTDSTLKRSIASEPGFGGLIGVNVPFASLGHVSVLALTLGFSYNQYSWKEINKAYNLDGSYKSLPHILNAKTTQIGMPVGIDYKIGCDAINSKRMLLGATLGVGAIPHFNSTSLDSVSKALGPQQSIGVNPYAKAEVSFFIGICVKFRAMYSMGNVELMNMGINAVAPYTHGPFKLTTNSQTSFSFIIMPFSYKWRETNWYNTYDSYNWNERLN